jgi:hypothetical protein
MATAVLPSSDLRELLGHRARACVSIFVPTHPAGAEIRQAPVRLKNLLRAAEERLAARGLAREAIRDLLEPARERLGEPGFWRDQERGLALFLAPGLYHEHRTPHPVAERVAIGEEFEIRPLLPLLTGEGRFHLLSLSQGFNRLYEASRHSIRVVPTPGVPPSLEAALRLDEPGRPQLQLHGTGRLRPGAGHGVFHGQAFTEDDARLDLLRYCRQVDRALAPFLGAERRPLVLAAVGYLQAIYREASSRPALLPQGIDGNPELTDPEALRRAALPLVEPWLRAEIDRDRARLGDLSATREASTAIAEIVPAAWHGRVDTLFLDRDRRVPGRYRPETGELRVAPPRPVGGDRIEESGDDLGSDLLDVAARRTLAHGGRVHALAGREMPNGAVAAAIFRWPLEAGAGRGLARQETRKEETTGRENGGR